MFPSAYNAALVKAMRKGSRSLVAILFDGAQSSASDVTAFLGAPKSANNGAVKTSIKHADRGVALSDMQPQLVHMSYFDMKTADAPPNFEMDYQLFPNGVIDQLKLSYGDVVIGGTMRSLEYFPSGGC